MKIFRLALVAACVGALVAPSFAAAESSGSASSSPLLNSLAPKAKGRKARANYFNPFNAASRSQLTTTRLGTPLLSIGGGIRGGIGTASASQNVFRASTPVAAQPVAASPAPVVISTPTAALAGVRDDSAETPTAGGSSSIVVTSAVVPVRPPFRPPVRSPFRPPPRPPF